MGFLFQLLKLILWFYADSISLKGVAMYDNQKHFPAPLLKNIVFTRIEFTHHSEALELENSTFFQEA